MYIILLYSKEAQKLSMNISWWNIIIFVNIPYVVHDFHGKIYESITCVNVKNNNFHSFYNPWSIFFTKVVLPSKMLSNNHRYQWICYDFIKMECALSSSASGSTYTGCIDVHT